MRVDEVASSWGADAAIVTELFDIVGLVYRLERYALMLSIKDMSIVNSAWCGYECCHARQWWWDVHIKKGTWAVFRSAPGEFQVEDAFCYLCVARIRSSPASADNDSFRPLRSTDSHPGLLQISRRFSDCDKAISAVGDGKAQESCAADLPERS